VPSAPTRRVTWQNSAKPSFYAISAFLRGSTTPDRLKHVLFGRHFLPRHRAIQAHAASPPGRKHSVKFPVRGSSSGGVRRAFAAVIPLAGAPSPLCPPRHPFFRGSSDESNLSKTDHARHSETSSRAADREARAPFWAVPQPRRGGQGDAHSQALLLFDVRQPAPLLRRTHHPGTASNPRRGGLRSCVETRPPEVVANIAICLIHQADDLLDQQLRRLELDFLKDGGLAGATR
jgi:four helix bundle suffix protein